MDADVVVELVGMSGECVVYVVVGTRKWGAIFDLLTDDVDELAFLLGLRMGEEIRTGSPLSVLLHRRIAEARMGLRWEVKKRGKESGNQGAVH